MTTATTRKLNMKFGNEDGSKNVSINDPLTDIDGETTLNAMNEIVALETLVDSNGKLLDMVVGAFLPRETVCCNNCTVAIFEYTGKIWRLHSWMNLTE